MKLSTVVSCKTVSSKLEFRETRPVRFTLYSRAQLNFYPYFPHFFGANFLQFGIEKSPRIGFSSSEFHETHCSESHVLHKGVNEILTYFSTFLTALNENQDKR